jgi:hypothetical protein
VGALADASEPADVERALAMHEALGTRQVKAEGSPNNTANYGVACGISVCKLMLRDLAGAWEAGKLASTYRAERRRGGADPLRDLPAGGADRRARHP